MRLFLLTSLTMMAFAANSILNRAALADAQIGPAGFALLRLAGGAAMLAALVWFRRRRLLVLDEVSAASVAGLAIYMLGFTFAYLSLDAGIGALILFGVVQITMFAGALLAGERPGPLRWIGAVVAFSGLAWLMAPSARAPDPVGAALMALAGAGWGYYSLYGRRVTTPLLATAGNFALAVPIAAVIWLLAGEGGATPLGIVLALVSGALTSGLGYALWYGVLPRLDATLAAIAQLMVPLIAVAGGMLFLGEGASWRFAAASILILGGVGLSLRRK